MTISGLKSRPKTMRRVVVQEPKGVTRYEGAESGQNYHELKVKAQAHFFSFQIYENIIRVTTRELDKVHELAGGRRRRGFQLASKL
jgi:hypothetical protein